MDVAHFKNKYRKLLKNINRRIVCLYMAAIGRLLMTQNLNEAENIIVAICLLENGERQKGLFCLTEKRLNVSKRKHA